MLRLAVGLLLAALPAQVLAEEATVTMNAISASGIGDKVGTVALADTAEGLKVTYDLAGLPGASHGFHVHEKGDCGPGEKDGTTQAGLAAGGHYDPGKTGAHKGPEGDGHKGDLPLIKASGGAAKGTVVAPRLKLADVRGKALMVHEGSDTYSDKPEMGGGKGRIACGVAPTK